LASFLSLIAKLLFFPFSGRSYLPHEWSYTHVSAAVCPEFPYRIKYIDTRLSLHRRHANVLSEAPTTAQEKTNKPRERWTEKNRTEKDRHRQEGKVRARKNEKIRKTDAET
jgi:hypothetical protein